MPNASIVITAQDRYSDVVKKMASVTKSFDKDVDNLEDTLYSLNKNKITLLRSMGASKLQILTKLVIPSALPDFIGMLKICVGMAWIGSIMGEYIVSKAGLGYLIVYGGQVFKLDLVMAATFILCVLAAGMYFLVVLAEKLVIKHPR